MSPFSHRGLLSILSVGAVFLASGDATAGEAPAAEKVRFATVDGVSIHGTFYRGPKASPTVVMLHALGANENRNKKNWIELAKTLQSDFSVLTFDFRGHGDSVEIDGALYARYKENQAATKGGARFDRTKLEFKDIDKAYYPLFCNDVAAAKSYLERTKNDLGICNTQNFVLIGADQGATVGAIWAKSEFARYRMEITPTILNPMVYTPRFENRPEGKWFSAFCWLSITSEFGTRKLNLDSIVATPCRDHHVPAVFLYSDGDKKGRDTALKLDKSIKFSLKKDDKRLALTAAVGLKAGEKLSGVDLLQESLKTNVQIHEWLKLAVQNNVNEWTQRDFMKTLFAWRIRGVNVAIPARMAPPGVVGLAPMPYSVIQQIPEWVEKNVLFDNYNRFAQ